MNRYTDMQNIFNELSEDNKDIIILVAKSIKVAQDVTKRNYKLHIEEENVKEN